MAPTFGIVLLPGPSPDPLAAEIAERLRQQLAACNCPAALAAAGEAEPGGEPTVLVVARAGQAPRLAELAASLRAEPRLVVLGPEAAADRERVQGLFPHAEVLCHPFEETQLRLRLERLPSVADEEVGLVKQRLSLRLGLERMVGRSPAFRAAMDRVAIAARYDAPVLLSGENGTGKGLCARALHYLSPRAGSPFLPLSCTAVPETLIENELFGHVKGAYTDASSTQQGLAQAAEGGTILLDEIDGLSVGVQSKLLRFLQEKEYRPIGASRVYKANVRVVAATNADLRLLVRQARFREDLYHRLCVIPIQLPPLRQRAGDIPLLADHFRHKYARAFHKEVVGFSASVRESLLRYSWPGNVRELENVVQRAVIFAGSPVIEEVEIEAWPEGECGPFKLEKERIVSEFTRSYLRRVLAAAGGNVSEAARLAGKDRRAFWELMRRYEVGRAKLI
jgi:transcriptional regulator with GAF, ATPase, and Fis domain